MLKNVKIGAKLMLVKVPFILALIIAAAISIAGNIKVSQNGDGIYLLAECANKVSRMQGMIFQRQRLMRTVSFIVDDEDAVKSTLETLTYNNNLFVQYLQELTTDLEYADAQVALKQMQDNYHSFFREWEEYLSFVEQKDSESISALSFEVGQGGEELQLLCSSLVDILVRETALLKATTDRNEWASLICSTAFSVVALLTAILFGRYLSRLITKPVDEMLAAAQRLSCGDVNSDISIDAGDEIGQLARALNQMITFIRTQAHTIQTISHGDYTCKIEPRGESDIVNHSIEKLISRNGKMLSEVKNVSTQIHGISKQVTDTSTKLAEGVSEHANGVEGLSILLQQIMEDAQSNEKRAEENSENVKTLDNTVVDSTQYIQEMKLAMDDILHRSTDVAAIIELIEDIAFQTKMLSINAAIEAAHAGVYGSGFAIIAKQVHNLSMSTSNAVQQSATLIEKCLSSIQLGNGVLDKTATCLFDIKKFQDTHNDLTEKILASSERQKDSLEEVNLTFTQIMDVVTQNSSIAEETSAIAEEMEEQVRILNNMVSMFRLPEMQHMDHVIHTSA